MAKTDAYEYTRKKTKESKTNFYYSFLFLPKAKRDAIFTVYSFCRHTDDIVDDARDVAEARHQLDGWRAELDACYRRAPGHPITQALRKVTERFPIPAEYFHDLIDGVEMDLTRNRYDTFEELATYCYHVAGVVGLICIEIFGYRNPQAKEYARYLGTALQLTNILRDVGEDGHNGRVYLPREDLDRFRYPEEDLMRQVYSPAFVELMRFEADRARRYFNQAQDHYERRDHHLLFPAEIMKKIYSRILDRIVSLDYNVFRERVRLPTRQKLSIALGTWLESRWKGLWSWAPTRS